MRDHYKLIGMSKSRSLSTPNAVSTHYELEWEILWSLGKNLFLFQCSKAVNVGGWWWHMLLIPALGRQKQANLCEFEASPVYRTSSKPARTTQRNLVPNNNRKAMNVCSTLPKCLLQAHDSGACSLASEKKVTRAVLQR